MREDYESNNVIDSNKSNFIGMSGGVDKYNNDVNKHNIEYNSNNNNRVKDNRECGILYIEC